MFVLAPQIPGRSVDRKKRKRGICRFIVTEDLDFLLYW